ncbi:MAG: gamma-glutamyltransferase [Oleiphilus sp.]
MLCQNKQAAFKTSLGRSSIDFTWIFTFIITSLFSLHGVAEQISDQVAPEYGTPELTNTLSANASAVSAKQFMAVTAHPLATQAAYDILDADGSAIDAMVAVQTVLGLVEPQSSGLGGGAFALYYDAKRKTLHSFDGRETAPIAAAPELFMSDDTTPMQFFEAVVGGRSVGTPGTVKLLWELHKRFGKQAWSDILQPAIELSDEGFAVSPRLAYSLARDQSRLMLDPETANYFLPKGKPIESGTLLKNPAYANTLRQLAKHGGDYFYNSDISKAIIDKVRGSANPGFLAQSDFDRYSIIERPANCFNYQVYSICGMGPPSSGAISVNQILGILENFDLASLSPKDSQTWQLIAEASRLAFADRGLYIADPAFVDIPAGLTDKGYLQQRSQQIIEGKASSSVEAGTPNQSQTIKRQTGNSPEQESTTHFVIVDKAGNIVSMTSTIENAFGSRLMVEGFLLNNELTDFSFLPQKNGQWVANRVEPGKRPRSSMAPTIVFHQKEQTPYLALGSPGGSRIINFVATSLIHILDWKTSLQHAFDHPHIVNRFGKMEIEQGTTFENMAPEFKKMGYPISIQDINSGLHGILFTKDAYIGAADKRREGTVMGK